MPAGAGSFPGKGRDKLMAGKLRYEELPIASIEVSPTNVRKEDVEEGLDELAQSIKEIGLQQPIVVCRDGAKYKLIIGQRRYLACKKLGMTEIPALIRHISDDTEATIISFSENIHRIELGYGDKMRVAIQLLSKLKSVSKVAAAIGVSQQTVRNYLGYAGVPDGLKDLVDRGRISAQTAMAIAKSIPDEQKAVKIAEKVREIPTTERRRRLIEIAKENPARSVPEIVKLAKRQKFGQVTLDLAPRLAEALESACREYKGEPTDIATEALEEWLSKRGFLK